MSSYRFQPEPLTSLIYWSGTFLIFFVGLIVTLEKSHLFWGSFVIWSIFTFFVWLGLKRYLYFSENQIIVHSLLRRNRRVIDFDDISRIEMDNKSIVILNTGKPCHLLLGKKTAKKLKTEQLKNPAFAEKLKMVSKIKIDVNN